MSLADIQTLFDYDTWANDRIFDSVATLSADALKRDRSTSHGSIFGTLVHLVGAEEVWLSRWQGNAGAILPREEQFPTLEALRARWNAIRGGREAFVSSLDDAGLDAEIVITTSTGKSYRHTYREMFQHVVNHSSYHRGQIVTLLRQSGAEPPTTDLIHYHRTRS